MWFICWDIEINMYFKAKYILTKIKYIFIIENLKISHPIQPSRYCLLPQKLTAAFWDQFTAALPTLCNVKTSHQEWFLMLIKLSEFCCCCSWEKVLVWYLEKYWILIDYPSIWGNRHLQVYVAQKPELLIMTCHGQTFHIFSVNVSNKPAHKCLQTNREII